MSDLVESAEFVVDLTPRERERKPSYTPDGLEKGVCRECGVEASTPQGTYCDEHKTRQRKSPSAREGESTPSGTDTVRRPRNTPATGRGAPKPDEWSSKVFDKVTILATAVFAGSMVRRYQLNDPDDAIADSLTMTDDEARRVAKPLGRFVAGTGLSKKYGRKVLDNSDLLDAGFAVYDYMDRVNRTLRQYSQGPPLASVTPIRSQPAPQQEGSDHGSTEPQTQQPGIPAGGNLPDLNGAVFVP